MQITLTFPFEPSRSKPAHLQTFLRGSLVIVAGFTSACGAAQEDMTVFDDVSKTAPPSLSIDVASTVAQSRRSLPKTDDDIRMALTDAADLSDNSDHQLSDALLLCDSDIANIDPQQKADQAPELATYTAGETPQQDLVRMQILSAWTKEGYSGSDPAVIRSADAASEAYSACIRVADDSGCPVDCEVYGVYRGLVSGPRGLSPSQLHHVAGP